MAAGNWPAVLTEVAMRVTRPIPVLAPDLGSWDQDYLLPCPFPSRPVPPFRKEHDAISLWIARAMRHCMEMGRA